jgi:hypothetical protein
MVEHNDRPDDIVVVRPDIQKQAVLDPCRRAAGSRLGTDVSELGSIPNPGEGGR